MSTNFLVLSKQNDLSSARSAELQAQITYAKAVTAPAPVAPASDGPGHRH